MTTPRLLSDRYELGPALGYGGMSEVHGGRDVRLGRDVAIKVLRADLARDPQFQTRFRREAQNAAGLNHPAIVAVYDTGEAATENVPLPYIVMEYVPGRTLRDIVKADGPLDPLRACEVVAEICAALDFSHRHGIIHRDVKPANVMITPDGAVKVMDFGIARALSDAQPAMTQTAAVIGTAQYLSPEQARGELVDARSDVYATGCVLFELLTGRPPFTGDSPVAVAYQHVREDPPAPSEINPSIPPELDAITLQALNKNPDDRYQSAEDMRSDLLRVLAGYRPSAPLMMSPQDRTGLMNGARPTVGDGSAEFAQWQAEQEQARKARRRKRLGIAALVAVLLAALAGGIYLLSPSAHRIAVPDVTGQTQDAALATLGGARLSPTPVPVASRPEQNGRVIDTNPAVGVKVDPGTRVEVRVGRGPDAIPVPSLIGQTADNAPAIAQRAGLTLAAVPQRREVDDPSQVNKVLAQNPSAGTPVPPGTAILLTVGAQRETLKLPNVVGQSQDTAKSTLEGVGLQVSPVQVDGQQPPGTVVSTSPSAGSTVTRNSTVTLQVSKGNRLPVPSVTGQTTSQAAQTLSAAGFTGTVSQSSRPVTDPSQIGRIVSQSPAAGSLSGANDPISVVVGASSGGSSSGGDGTGSTSGNGGGVFPGGDLFPGGN